MNKNRLCIVADEFVDRKDEFIELLHNPSNAEYIGSLKFSKHMFTERAWIEELAQEYRINGGNKYPIIADLGLSGGYDASVKEVCAAMRLHGFRDATFVIGRVPEDEARFIIDAFSQDQENDAMKIKFMLTGALPEINPDFFYEEFGQSPVEYTTRKAKVAQRIGSCGLYAATKYMPKETALFTLGVGISHDGESYESAGVMKTAMTVEQGLQTCSQIAVGKVLTTPYNALQDNFDELKNIIDEVSEMAHRAYQTQS